MGLNYPHPFLQCSMPLLIFPHFRSRGGKVLDELIHSVVIPLEISCACDCELHSSPHLHDSMGCRLILFSDVYNPLDHDKKGSVRRPSIAKIIKPLLHPQRWTLSLAPTPSLQILCPRGVGPLQPHRCAGTLAKICNHKRTCERFHKKLNNPIVFYVFMFCS